jgi:uncharacterized protein YqeY
MRRIAVPDRKEASQRDTKPPAKRRKAATNQSHLPVQYYMYDERWAKDMSLKEKLSADLKDAMRARDQLRIDTLRAAISAFTYKKVETGKDLSEDEELAVLQKQVKQRNDSIAEYTKAQRSELAERETRERDILATYLPAQKSEAEVRQIVRKIIEATPAESRNQGAVMKVAMSELKGLADGNLVRQIVMEELKTGN